MAFCFKCEKAENVPLMFSSVTMLLFILKLEFDCPECNINDSCQNNSQGWDGNRVRGQKKKRNMKDFRVEPDDNETHLGY